MYIQRRQREGKQAWDVASPWSSRHTAFQGSCCFSTTWRDEGASSLSRGGGSFGRGCDWISEPPTQAQVEYEHVPDMERKTNSRGANQLLNQTNLSPRSYLAFAGRGSKPEITAPGPGYKPLLCLTQRWWDQPPGPDGSACLTAQHDFGRQPPTRGKGRNCSDRRAASGLGWPGPVCLALLP